MCNPHVPHKTLCNYREGSFGMIPRYWLGVLNLMDLIGLRNHHNNPFGFTSSSRLLNHECNILNLFIYSKGSTETKQILKFQD